MRMLVGLIVLLAGAAHAQSDGWRREVGEQGQPWSEAWMVDGLIDGPWTAWHANGFIADVGQFRRGREEGVWQSFDDAGRLASEGQWVAGRPEGTWRFFHVSGAVAFEGAYVGGLRSGDWVERFVDGRLFRVVRWTDGEPAMSLEEAECRLVNGLEWRVDLARRDEGCLDLEGRRFGLWRGYHADGTLAWERTYIDDLEDGPAMAWQSDGTLRHHGIFNLGAPVGRHVWVDDGQLTVVAYGDGDGPWRDTIDGVVREEGEWAGALRVGTWRTWDAHGVPTAEVTWRDGVRTHQHLRRDGLTIEGGYVEGMRDGTWRAWNDDAKLVWQGGYVGGEREGEWRFARTQGDVALVLTFSEDVPMLASRWYVNGRSQIEETAEARVLSWADGEVLREDAMALGALADPVDDPETAWQRALELQAWLLAAPPVDEDVLATTVTPRAERYRTAETPSDRLVMPITREMPDAEGQSNEAGERDGLWTFYWPDGARREQTSYAAGLRDGPARGWDASGRLTWQGAYRADQEEGEWLTFHANAQVRTRGTYRAGRRQGPWTSYYDDGQVASRGAFVDDAEDGPWRGYDARGQTTWEGAYRAGERTGRWTFTSARGSRSKTYSEH